jgi:hypothetical protein
MTSPWRAEALAKAAQREIKEGQNKKRKLSYEKPDKQS